MEPSPVTDSTTEGESKNHPMSIYLIESELEHIKDLADQLGVACHALL
jgi:hypothetical protein